MNKDDMIILNEMAEIIRKNGVITQTELWKQTKLSIWQFDKIKKFIPQIFEDIQYNRKKQSFISQSSLSLFSKEELK